MVSGEGKDLERISIWAVGWDLKIITLIMGREVVQHSILNHGSMLISK